MYQWSKKIVQWKVGKVLYMSIPFTWLLPKAEMTAKEHKGKVIAGGPAIDLMGCDWAETPGTCEYDTLAFHNTCATFTTRGCPNKCKFCAVPKIEGDFVELETWKPAPLICDNNILASSTRHFKKVIDSLLNFPFVDFNQGLQANLFIAWRAEEIKRLNSVLLRFAFDFHFRESELKEAIDIAAHYGLKNIRIYCLVGFKDSPEDAHYRLEKVRQWGIRPNPMRYQPLDTLVKNSYVAPGWTDRELKNTMGYYSRLRWLEHIPYEEYAENLQEELF